MEASHHLIQLCCLLWQSPPVLACLGQGDLHSPELVIAGKSSEWCLGEAYDVINAANQVMQWHMRITA